MQGTFNKLNLKNASLKSKMLTSALPFMMIAMAPSAYSQTVTNTANVSVPAYANDPTSSNNTAADTDTVLAVIVSADDTASGVNGTDGATGVVNVFANDTLNGSPVNPADVTLTETVADPTGALTLNPDGSVDVAPGTPAGTYELTYEICETLNPSNCTTSTVTIVVDEAPIAAAPESFPVINGADGGVTTSVLASDMLNGQPVDPADVTLTVGSSDPELTLDPATGLITVAPGTPAGTYTVEYTICETLNPTNCATVIETVTVGESPIDSADDTASGVNGTDGATGVVNVFDNDTLNGQPVNPADVTLTETVADPTGALTLNPDGSVDVAPGTPAGTYELTYEICETLNPTNCTTSTVTVVVDEAPIAAAPESFPVINGADGGVTTSVLASDMLNGQPVDPADVTLTVGSSDPELTLDPATGLITVAAGTPAGTYTVEYTICETLNPNNCATVTETVVVEASEISAQPEVFEPINGSDGGVVGSVLTSDTLDGETPDLTQVTLTVDASDPEVTLDPATGLITVAAGTPAGSYTVTYTICETLNPSNCATITETITVEAPTITAESEVFDPINGSDGGVVGSVLTSDTLGGETPDLTQVTLTVDASDPEVTLDPATGLITVAAGTPAGSYTVTYTICETLNPSNCATITETITVEAPVIETSDDVVENIDGTTGGLGVINVLENDILNGETVSPESVIVTLAPGTSLPPGITLNPDGSVDVDPGTAEGTYVIEYQICEVLNPTNCTTATVTLTIDPPVASLSGIVFLDVDGDDERDDNEELLVGWIVEILDSNGNVVKTVVTDENGFYQAEGLSVGDYTVRFRNSETNAVFGIIETVSLQGGDNVIDQNLPIDPSGVVYDSITREPIEGAILTFTDANGVPLPPICFIDPSQQNQTTDDMGMYRFDIVPGADLACPTGQTNYLISFDAPASHLDTNSTIIGPEDGFFIAPAGNGPFAVSPDATAPQNGDATTYHLGFTLGQGSRDIINNHIPLDPIGLTRSPLTVTKVTPQRDVNIGDLVPYTITVTNTEDLPRVDIDIVDLTPHGFKFVEDTARLNGVAIDPEVDGRNLIINDLDFAGNETQTFSLVLVVGAGVSEGVFTNQAFARDIEGADASLRAEAQVRISPDPLFDCSEVIGKVFDDKNKDGYQTEGEPGLAGIRLATATGLLVTTDQYGRYHITCAAVPNGQIGSNFILKVDEKSLPTGYHPTSENPRVIRLTRGKVSKANFAAALENVLTLELNDQAFIAGTATLKGEYASQLGLLIEALKGQESTLRLQYLTEFDDGGGRLAQLADQIKDMWKSFGDDYDLNIERKTTIRRRGRTTTTREEG